MEGSPLNSWKRIHRMLRTWKCFNWGLGKSRSPHSNERKDKNGRGGENQRKGTSERVEEGKQGRQSEERLLLN